MFESSSVFGIPGTFPKSHQAAAITVEGRRRRPGR